MIEAKTKGIWIWIGNFPDDPKRALVLLDTEGFGDQAKGSPDHDSKLCVLVMMLSSVFIYNSKNTIDFK